MQRFTAFIDDDEGQNLVEFALLLPVLMYILMGIMQFGLIFATYLTMNNASREGARWASIYIYDNTLGSSALNPALNDAARNNGLLDRLAAARGILNIDRTGNTQNFSAGTTWSPGSGGTTCLYGTNTDPTTHDQFYFTNGDTLVCYSNPTGVPVNDVRKGYYIYVESYYHLQVFMPLLQPFLPADPSKGAPWIRLPGRITVVIN